MNEGSIFFISDLHLDLNGKRNKLSDRFFDFLAHPALKANTLYILGDLFDAYVGEPPDGNPHYPKVIDALRTYAKTGRQLFLMRGNRDFLMEPLLERKIGCKFIHDPHLIDLAGHKTLLTHGDSLSIDKKIYPYYRLLTQYPLTQRIFLALPYRLREFIANCLKSDPSQPKEPFVLPNNAVRTLLEQYHADWIIHGHFHTEYIKAFPRVSPTAQQWSLGAWDETGCVLEVTPHGMQFCHDTA